MGNRAVITASKSKTNGVGIYVHWNGGPESVVALLDVARERGYRDPASDESYAMARLCGLYHEFFGPEDGLSLGIGQLNELDCDNFDNGVYVIGKGWTVTERWGKGSSPLTAQQVEDIRNTQRHKDIVASLALPELVAA